MKNWPEAYFKWEGGASELALIAEQLESLLPIGTKIDGNAPNVRLVRNYVTLGVLSRAERRGKEAIFEFRQLLEFLVARLLVSEGWPLPKIGELVRGASDEHLLELLPQSHATRAQKLVTAFQGKKPGAGQTDPISARIADTVLNSARLRSELQSMGNPNGAPTIAHVVLMEIAPWCKLLIDSAALKRLDGDAMDRLADVVRKSLARARTMKGDNR